MNDTEMRERLVDLADDAPKGFTAPPPLLRRARRRVALNVTASVVLIAALVAGAIVGVRSVGNARGKVIQRPTPNLFAKVHGWIAYVEGSQIVAVDPDNPANRISLGQAARWQPIGWSHDGAQLLLQAMPLFPRRVGDSRLLVLRSDGSRTPLPGESWGSFSPDGTLIVYALPGEGLFVVPAEGGPPRLVVKGNGGEPLLEAAAWSPDGSKIAFIDFTEDSPKYGHHTYGVSIVNADGTGLRELVHLGSDQLGEAGGIAWSPDGSRLALSMIDIFKSPRSRIFIVDADGSGLRQVTNERDISWPAWSPDGSRIAFVHAGALFTMTPDGSDVRKIEGAEPAPNSTIAWNPIG